MSTAVVTPYRRTHVRFDVTDYTTWEAPMQQTRGGQDIVPNQSGTAPATSAVERLVSGAWVLQPHTDTISQTRERTDTGNPVIPQSDMRLVDGYATVPRWRYPGDLTGLPAAGTGVASTGDNFMVLRVAAGANWGGTLSDDVAAYPQPTQPTANVEMSRHMVSNVEYQADQPFVLRFGLISTGIDAPDSVIIKYFGGPASAYGEGRYSLALSGSGRAYLEELVSDTPHGVPTWRQVDSWQYCEPSRVGGASHYVRIWPHRGSRTGYIEFYHYTNQRPASGNPVTRYARVPDAPTSHLFRFTFPTPSGARGPYPRSSVTGHGPIRLDVRADQRIQWQIQRTTFPSDGYLTDSPFLFPFYPSARGTLLLTFSAWVIPGTHTIVASIYDALTDTELATPTRGDNYVYYPMPNGRRQLYARFHLTTTDANSTPYLWDYQVQRDGYIGVNSPGEWTGGLAQRIEVSGPESDPSHETAMVEIEDLTNALATLRTRASIPFVVETEYDSADSTKRSVLFRGYAERTIAHKRGMAGSTYPDPNWRRYQINAVGMWTRLNETLTEQRVNLIDSSAPDGSGGYLPYKVTDVVRNMLYYAGFLPGQVDVPDWPVRFFPTVGGSNDLILAPLTNVGEFVPRTLRDYLGAFLVWDANAGSYGGMWRVRQAPVSPYNNLAAFVTAPPGAGVTSRPETYGSTNWVGTPTAFIQKGTLDTSVKRPEANAVLVVGAGTDTPQADGTYLLSQWAVNALSFNPFTDDSGTTIVTADPTSPDYLGRRVPLFVVDPNLQTQEAVDWVCRRVYAVACHAVKIATFTAPLVLVVDSTDAYQANPRPLRYYDAVTVNGTQWLVRNVNPSYHKDSVQMARYELEAPPGA